MLPQLPTPRILFPRLLIVAGLILSGNVLRASTIYSNFDASDGYSISTGLIATDGNFNYSVARASGLAADGGRYRGHRAPGPSQH